MKKEIPYSQMSAKQMAVLYKEHAAKIGRKPLRPMPKDRVEMAKALALLLTHQPAPPLRVRDVALEELAKLSHYEYASTGQRITCEEADAKPSHDLISVGFPYAIVLLHVKTRLANTSITVADLCIYSANVRKGLQGFKRVKLPTKRAYERKSDAKR